MDNLFIIEGNDRIINMDNVIYVCKCNNKSLYGISFVCGCTDGMVTDFYFDTERQRDNVYTQMITKFIPTKNRIKST